MNKTSQVELRQAGVRADPSSGVRAGVFIVSMGMIVGPPGFVWAPARSASTSWSWFCVPSKVEEGIRRDDMMVPQLPLFAYSGATMAAQKWYHDEYVFMVTVPFLGRELAKSISGFRDVVAALALRRGLTNRTLRSVTG